MEILRIPFNITVVNNKFIVNYAIDWKNIIGHQIFFDEENSTAYFSVKTKKYANSLVSKDLGIKLLTNAQKKALFKRIEAIKNTTLNIEDS